MVGSVRSRAGDERVAKRPAAPFYISMRAPFGSMRGCASTQEREITMLATEKARLEADKAQLRASVAELSSALTAAQVWMCVRVVCAFSTLLAGGSSVAE